MITDNDNDADNLLDRAIRDHLRRLFDTDDTASGDDDRFATLIEQIRQQDSRNSAAADAVADGIVGLLPQLRGFARSLTRHSADADDLVQETVAKALANTDKFAPDTNLRAWVFTILRNQFYSTRRKSKREVQDIDGIAASKLVQIADQEDRLAFGEFQAAFLHLPQDQREALMLVGVSGLSYEQAARTCGCAVGTIKSRVNRARVRLAEVLDIARHPPASRAPRPATSPVTQEDRPDGT